MSRGVREFSVANVEKCEPTQVILIGRNFAHPLTIGDRFYRSYRLDEPQAGDRYSDPWVAVDEQSVDLRIDRIESYGASIEKLGPGMTARLELSGKGVDRVEDGRILALIVNEPPA